MTEQTNAAKDPILDAIPAAMREDYARLADGIASFDEQIEALQQQRLALIEERSAILDMAAADTVEDAAIVALRDTGKVGHERMEEAARSVSPLVYSTIQFSPTDSYADLHPGPYLSLMNHRERPIAGVDPADVVEALVEFARRFCPDLPHAGEHPGMVYGDILTERESMAIFYTPDGSEAVLRPRHRYDEVHGTLVEVAAAAVREAQHRATRIDDNDY